MNPSTYESLVRWVEHSITPGGFLLSVLENDLQRASLLATPDSLKEIPEILEFLHEYAPMLCWGSVDKVTTWMHRGPEIQKLQSSLERVPSWVKRPHLPEEQAR